SNIPWEAVISDTGTSQLWAAAPFSIALAVAPAMRRPAQRLRMPWLPPVNWLPNRPALKAACSTRTFSQGTSSSSARIMGMEVITFCPNSGLGAMMVTTPLSPIFKKALISNHSLGISRAERVSAPLGLQAFSKLKPRIRPPEAMLLLRIKARRPICVFIKVIFFVFWLDLCLGPCGQLYGLFDPEVGATAADVAVHGRFYFLFRGGRIAFQKGGGRHDLSRLAIAALGHVHLQPGLLHGMVPMLGKSLDGGYPGLPYARDREDAGPGGPAVQVDGAGTALGDPATVFGPHQVQVVPEDP